MPRSRANNGHSFRAATSIVTLLPSQTASDNPGFPNIIIPNNGTWLWNKADPKTSLKAVPSPPIAGQPATVDQSGSAAAWILNLIEITHWISFPIGFLVTFILFDNAPLIAPHVGNSNLRVFCLLLGLLSQVYGGGISGNMMHRYEGWQVAPFRNPLDGCVVKHHVEDFNNAWLRSVAYEMLFAFQTLGLTLFNLGRRVWFPGVECYTGSSLALRCFRGTKRA